MDRQPGDFTIRPREEFAKPKNYIDLFRGGIGAYLLMFLAFSLQEGGNRRLLLAVQVILFGVGVLIQTLRWRRRLTLFAPLFFLSGVTIGLAGLQAGLAAVALTWVINVVLPGPSLFLFVQALFIGLASLLPGGARLPITAAACLTAFPLFISLITRQRLSALSKKS